jgi:oxygen-dependent protoporphyrinogen oxidase
MQTLTDALANALAPIEHDVTVRRVTRDPEGTFVIEGWRRGEPFMLRGRTVVLCTPARTTAAMIGGLDADCAAALCDIEYAPITVIANAYRRGDVAHSLAGFGFLVPSKERRAILGCLFSSTMFDGRAPGGPSCSPLSRAAGEIEIMSVPDATVADIVQEELSDLLGATQPSLWQEVVRWPQASRSTTSVISRAYGTSMLRKAPYRDCISARATAAVSP